MGSGSPGPLPVPRMCSRSAQSRDGRTCRALASPNPLYPRRPCPAPPGGPGSPPFPLPGRDPVRRPRVCPACRSPAALPAPLRLCPSFWLPCPSQVPDLRLNLRRRRPRSQGNTPKRRCRVTSARRRGRPGAAAVRGKEEEFPRGKPRERSSPTWPDQKGPKAFPWPRPAS